MYTDQVTMNKYGFYWVKEKPRKEELEKYYSQKYYQKEKGNYSLAYTEMELTFFQNKIEQKYFLLKFIEKKKQRPSMLDFGCGEGFALDFFQKRGWDVLGLDYSNFGCTRFNPHLLDKVIKGDVYEKATELIRDKIRFDVVWLKHVLEHVPDPLEALYICNQLTNDDGVLMIEVPNDFSVVQLHLLQANRINKPFWISLPDHLSYFNKEGLINICKEAGWSVMTIIADFPIDFSLFLDETNYTKKTNIGPLIHLARVEIENLLHNISIEKVNNYYEAMADLGIGRGIIGFFKKQ